MSKNRIITGSWDGEVISREMTAEEKLEEAGISVDSANLFIILNENEIQS